MASHGVPEAYHAPNRPRCERTAVGAEGHARDRLPVSLAGAEGAGRGDVPQAHRVILGTRHQRATIGTERHAKNSPLMSLTGAEGTSRGDVPEAHGVNGSGRQ